MSIFFCVFGGYNQEGNVLRFHVIKTFSIIEKKSHLDILQVIIWFYPFFRDMKLYVQTPRYHDNKYLPHLVEHCVLYSDDLRAFLPLQEVDGSTYT